MRNILTHGQIYVYSPLKQLLSETDQNENTVRYTYDSTGSITCEKGPEGKTVRYTYDSTGKKRV